MLNKDQISGDLRLIFALILSMENVINTPHVGGYSDMFVHQSLPIFKENLRRYLNGERRDLINIIEWQK